MLTERGSALPQEFASRGFLRCGFEKFCVLQTCEDGSQIDDWTSKAWNPLNDATIADWLTDRRSQDDKNRLKTMGNLVVPVQARLSQTVLSQMQTLVSQQS